MKDEKINVQTQDEFILIKQTALQPLVIKSYSYAISVIFYLFAFLNENELKQVRDRINLILE